MDKIYIIGHKSPDLDSVASAISYAVLKNEIESTDKYVPAIFGEVNKETKYILEKTGVATPESLDNIAGKNVILVDHNEFIQAADGIEEANIVEVLDHHKVDFKYSGIIPFRAFPAGAACSIIFDLYQNNNVVIDKEVAVLMLGGILIDTVITKSPTCTDRDKEIIEKISEIAEVDDWKEFGMELFKVRSNVTELSIEEIIKNDFKDFNFNGNKFGIGQIETVDLNEFESLEERILEGLEKMKGEEGYHTLVLFITDIIKEGSEFIVVTDDQEKIEEAMGSKLEHGKTYIDGIISRKKQVVPMFEKVF
jgi:manganese-dependent inorganic pyrophosphatase